MVSGILVPCVLFCFYFKKRGALLSDFFLVILFLREVRYKIRRTVSHKSVISKIYDPTFHNPYFMSWQQMGTNWCIHPFSSTAFFFIIFPFFWYMLG